MKAAVFVCIVIICIIAPTFADIALTGWTAGRSTYYTTPDNGECGYGTLTTSQFPFRHIAAANTAFFASATSCGNCYEIQCVSSPYLANACTGTNVIVQVSDECPAAENSQWCSGDITHFDLSTNAFNILANPAAGVISTQFRQVTCDVSGNINYVIKEGSNAWWFALLVENVGGHGGLYNVEILPNGGKWTAMQRQSYNYWLVEASGNGIALPASIRVTSSSGAQIVDTNIITYISGGATLYSSQQFAYNTYSLAGPSIKDVDADAPRTIRTSIFGQSTSADIGLIVGLLCVALVVGVVAGAGVSIFIIRKKQRSQGIPLYDYQPAPN